jgi:hypothetical protein
MKASELVSELSRLIDQHGDCEIVFCKDRVSTKADVYSDLSGPEVVEPLHGLPTASRRFVIRHFRRAKNPDT